jgi:hypothetical protein
LIACIRSRSLSNRSRGKREKAAAPLSFSVEAEKGPKQILGRDSEKSDFLQYVTINDLMLGKGQVTPEIIVFNHQKDFSYRLFRRGGG